MVGFKFIFELKSQASKLLNYLNINLNSSLVALTLTFEREKGMVESHMTRCKKVSVLF